MNHWDDDFLLGGVAVAKKEKSVGEVKGGVTARFNVFFIIVVTVGNAYLAQSVVLLLQSAGRVSTPTLPRKKPFESPFAKQS